MMHRLLQMHTHVSNAPGEVAILRNGLVRICDGNHCAAMILDYLYEEALILRESGPLSPSVTTNLSYLQEMMSDLFDKAIITSALAQLASLGYLDFNDATINRLDEEVYYQFPVNTAAVDDALIILKGEIPPQRIVPVQPTEEAPSTETQPEPPQPIEMASTRRNIRTEAKRVAYHRRRTEVLALPTTLTLEQWITTLNYFDWRCAYCTDGTYQVFEHYTPLFHGGGTTGYNCLPACNRCNARKMDAHPSVFEEKFPGEVIKRIKHYFAEVWESEAEA